MLYRTSAGLYGLATVSRFSQLSGIVQNRSSGITACLVVGTRTIHSPVLLLSSVSTFPSSAAAVLTTVVPSSLRDQPPLDIVGIPDLRESPGFVRRVLVVRCRRLTAGISCITYLISD
jgi:hypothetical protein